MCLFTDMCAGFSDDERAGDLGITDESDEDATTDGELNLLAAMLKDGGKSRRKTANIGSKSGTIKGATVADKQDVPLKCTSENGAEKEREDQVAWMKGKRRVVILILFISSSAILAVQFAALNAVLAA